MKWHVSFYSLCLQHAVIGIAHFVCSSSAIQRRGKKTKNNPTQPKYPYTIGGINGVLSVMHDSHSATNTRVACPSSSTLIIRTRKKTQKPQNKISPHFEKNIWTIVAVEWSRAIVEAVINSCVSPFCDDAQ